MSAMYLNDDLRADFESSVAFEGEMMALTGATRDHAQGVKAFVAKEKPVYEGR